MINVLKNNCGIILITIYRAGMPVLLIFYKLHTKQQTSDEDLKNQQLCEIRYT